MVTILVVIACAAGGCSPGDDTHPAEKVVQRMYDAQSAGDSDANMDAMLPANRRRLNPLGIIEHLSVSIPPFGIDLEDLTTVSVSDLEVELVEAEDDYALVQARGRVRFPVLMLEMAYCDQHDVRRHEGEWYVGIYAPERTARLERVLAIRQQELATGSGSGWGLDGLVAGMEKALDMCVPE